MVFSRWKHGSNGVPWSEAQTTSPLTRQRSRRQRYRAHRSCILEVDGADDRAVAMDAAGAARAI